MAGLLEGQLAKAIYDGFKNKLLKGTLKRLVPVALNAKGDPSTTTEQTWSIQGFVDGYSEFFRIQTGVPDTDAKVCIFAKSLPDGTRPKKDDLVELPAGTWYRLVSINVDPATALWECRASKIPPAASASSIF